MTKIAISNFKADVQAKINMEQERFNPNGDDYIDDQEIGELLCEYNTKFSFSLLSKTGMLKQSALYVPGALAASAASVMAKSKGFGTTKTAIIGGLTMALGNLVTSLAHDYLA